MKFGFFAKAFFIFVTAFAACSLPNDEDVKREFLAENPNFNVINLYVGEGNADFATYHIKYKKPNDNFSYEKIITYQRCDDDKWRCSCK